MKKQSYDIVIIGGGPTGLVLANLLGPSGLKVAVIEKQAEVYPIPRATHLDEETLRNFQLTGLMPELQKHIAPFGDLEIVNSRGKVLLKERVYQPVVEHGYNGSHFFDQPAFERILRNGLERFDNVNLIIDELISVDQNNEEVILTLAGLTRLKGRWAVGCDGGRSIVRTALNIEMDALVPLREWIIVDSILKSKENASLLPNGFRYMLETDRLCINAHGIGLNRRWEFELKPGEQQPTDETIKSWVARYISLDKIEITRIAAYSHNSLVAKQWRDKRIFLAGDAAHMMPPSAGQGLCSGVRDAVNLAWKLEAVMKETLPLNILDTYEQERKAHLSRILKRTLFINKRLTADTAFRKVTRSLELMLIENLPFVKNFLRKRIETPLALNTGYFDRSSSIAGTHLPQHNSKLTDDLIGYRFALITNNAHSQQQSASLENQGVINHNSSVNYQQWLSYHKIDFAWVRPDKIIHSVGKAP